MVNKTDVRNAVSRWLKDAKLEHGEEFSVFKDDGCIMIHIVNQAGERREDRK